MVITAVGPPGIHVLGLDDFRFEGTLNQPPEAFAAFEPIDVDDDEGTFRVVADGTDPDGNLKSVVAVIKTPSIDGLDVELNVDDEVKVKFDPEEGEVKISGPDPQVGEDPGSHEQSAGAEAQAAAEQAECRDGGRLHPGVPDDKAQRKSPEPSRASSPRLEDK